MRKIILFVSLVVFVSVVNAQRHEGRGGHRDGHRGPERSAPSVIRTAPPVMNTAPPVVRTSPPVVRTAPPVVRTSPPVVNTAPRVMRTRPQADTVSPRMNRFQGNVTQSPAQNRRSSGTMDRDRSRSWEGANWHRDRQGGQGRDRHGSWHHGGHRDKHYSHGGTSVFVPYWWYGSYPYNYNYGYAPYSPSYSSPSVYPNRIFICYGEDQVYNDRYHIDCPAPISWYNTSPAYDREDYQRAYRPEYVCPSYGASNYVEFSNSSDATTWWNNNCNTWVYTP